MRQMAICRATPADFATRGKKTRKMRIGFAGFCCRHCVKIREEAEGGELARAKKTGGYSCRSFSSEVDTLGSSISNSFAEHLAKCTNTPKRIRDALAVYKQIHPSQMAEFPFGSQRKKFQGMWRRIRAADIDEAAMNRLIREYRPGQPDLPDFINTLVKEPIHTKEVSKPTPKQAAHPKAKNMGRASPKFPTSKNKDTKRMLAMAEEDWDWSESGENGGIIKPADKELVSDYVFLTCRNLKPKIPTAADVAKSRRGSGAHAIIAGMCCMHCDDKDESLIAGSSRTFPTAPDNYASAFNTSLYNHMQKCDFIKDDLKRALADLRKIHSSQVGHLKAGSQRRFFGNLCNRLKKVKLPGKLPPGPPKAASPAVSRGAPRTPRNRKPGGRSGQSRAMRGGGDDAILDQYRFCEFPLQSFFCLGCRMVPLQFRARGSLCFAKPTLDFMSDHHENCKEDGFDLWFCIESLKDVLKGKLDVTALSNPLFKEIMLECFGQNQQLAEIFTTEISKVYQMSKHGGVTRAVENAVKAKSQGMWSKLPKTVDSTKVKQAFEEFAATIEGLSPVLADHDALVKYLLLICPSLQLHEGDEDEKDESAEEEGDINAKADEGSEVKVIKPPARRSSGKELRKTKKVKEEDEEAVEENSGGSGDDEVDKVQAPQRPRGKGKELRRKKKVEEEEEEDEDDEGNDDDDDDDGDEVIEITPRKPRGGKELRRRRTTNKPVYNEDDDEEDEDIEDELEDDDEEEDDEDGASSESGAEEEIESAQGDNGDDFEEEEPVDAEEGRDHSDPDLLMREGIDDSLEGEVSQEQMELDELED